MVGYSLDEILWQVIPREIFVASYTLHQNLWHVIPWTTYGKLFLRRQIVASYFLVKKLVASYSVNESL